MTLVDVNLVQGWAVTDGGAVVSVLVMFDEFGERTSDPAAANVFVAGTPWEAHCWRVADFIRPTVH